MRNRFLVATALISLCGIEASVQAGETVDTQASALKPAASISQWVQPPYQSVVAVRTAYVNPPAQLTRLIDLPLELEDRRILTTTATAAWFDGRLKSEGEFRHGQTPAGSLGQHTGSDQRLLRLGITARQGSFQYGLSLREAGKAVVDGPDQAVREMWGEWHLGAARVRTSLSDLWNNVDKDPMRSRITQTQERIALTLGRPAWPEVTVAFSRTALSSSLDPQGVAAQQKMVTAYEGALAYTGTGWNARATAGYASNADVLMPGMDSRALMYGVSGTYRLEHVLTLNPSLNLRDERQQWSGVRLLSRSGSLALAFAPNPRLSLKTLAGYNEISSTDHLVALTDFNTTSTVTWKPESLARYHASLSLETSHKVTHNSLGATQTLEDTSGVIRLQFADVVIW